MNRPILQHLRKAAAIIRDARMQPLSAVSTVLKSDTSMEAGMLPVTTPNELPNWKRT